MCTQYTSVKFVIPAYKRYLPKILFWLEKCTIFKKKFMNIATPYKPHSWTNNIVLHLFTILILFAWI
jgi:hypothetical protein